MVKYMFLPCSLIVVSVLLFFGYTKPDWESHTSEHWYNFSSFQKWIKEDTVMDVVNID